MTTAVRHFLMMAIVITMLALASVVRAGSVSLIDEDNAGDGSRFESVTNTVVITDSDNDLDICRYFDDGKTEIVLPRSSEIFTHARLVVRSFDVDENAQPKQGYPFPEQDNVIFNNQTLGYLSGEYQAWSSSVFPLAHEYVHAENLLEVDIDVLGQQQSPPNSLWCVAVDWGQLVLDGGEQQGAKLTNLALIDTLKAADDITLQVQADVLTPVTGDYLLELSLVDQLGHVIATQTSGANLYNRTADQTTPLQFVHTYDGSELTSGYYSLQAIVYEVGVTQNNVWPREVQDMVIHFFQHEQNAQPSTQTLIDQDGDTLLDHLEAAGDQDGDGIANVLDADDDGDGLSTRYEHQTLNYLVLANQIPNTDGDSKLNYLDTDDDDDGKSSASEGPWADSDQDGVLDFLDAEDDNPCFPASNHNLCDLDGDGLKNQEDNDVDGDGINNSSDSDSYPPVLADLIIPVEENTRFVVDMFATDQDADGDQQTYELVDGLDAVLFELDTTSGVIQFISAPDFDDGITEYEFKLNAFANGKQANAHIRVVLENVDDEVLQPLTDVDGSENTIIENAAAGTPVGITAQAIDGDGDSVVYKLINTFEELFAIDAQTGVVTISESGRLDFESQATYLLEIEASSTSSSGVQTAQFEVQVTEYISDIDNDGVPDSIDPDITDPCNPDQSAQQCIDNGGGNDNGGNDQDETDDLGKLGTGNDGVGSLAGFLLMLLFVVLPLNKTRQKLVKICVLGTAIGITANAHANSLFDEMDVYLGVGTGTSQLNPDTSGTDYQLDSGSSNAWKITAGWDLTDNLAIEGYYSQLGEASFKQGGTLKYSAIGGSAVYQHWMVGSAKTQNSFAVFGKAGANSLTNEGRNVRYEKNSVLQPLFAFGGEYVLPWQWSVRGELELFGTDATVVSLNAVKRFGFRSQSKPNPKAPSWEKWVQAQSKESITAEKPKAVTTFDVLISEEDAIAMIQALPPTAAIRERSIVIEPVVLDRDFDGVLDDEDQCEFSPKELSANENGCTSVEGILPNVNFLNNGSQLTKDSRSSLVQIAQHIQQLPQIVVEIQGHTNSQGDKKLSLALSKDRAQAVADALKEAGVPEKQLIVRGYGESLPIASNLTKDGQAQNQRIELHVLRSAK